MSVAFHPTKQACLPIRQVRSLFITAPSQLHWTVDALRRQRQKRKRRRLDQLDPLGGIIAHSNSEFSHMVSKNNTKTAWVLKCDIRKFFASVDQTILAEIIKDCIPDQDIVWLLSRVIGSFHSNQKGVGLPLGNLTFQLLVNIYMNEFDQFMKHKLKAEYYIRYADDFVIFSRDKAWLEGLLPLISDFLWTRLRLTLHPHKVSITTVASGVDFLGWVHFPDHRVLRTTTRRRVFRGIERTNGKRETVQSYLGLLKHGNTQKLRMQVNEIVNREVGYYVKPSTEPHNYRFSPTPVGVG